MKTEFVKIDKKLADQMLLKNNNNRRANIVRVSQYAKEMKDGNWFEGSGETIKICASGQILDGQHRLMAVSRANVSVRFLVVYGVENGAMPFIDTGKPRNATDVFAIEKITNPRVVPSIIRFWKTLDFGYSSTDSNSVNLSNSDILDLYHDRPKYWDEAGKQTLIWYLSFGKILTPSTIGGFYSLFQDINSNQAKEFFNQLCGGESITNQTIITLRNRLIQEKTSLKKSRASHRSALIVKTWNAFRTGNTIKSLMFNPEKEDFPKAI